MADDPVGRCPVCRSVLDEPLVDSSHLDAAATAAFAAVVSAPAPTVTAPDGRPAVLGDLDPVLRRSVEAAARSSIAADLADQIADGLDEAEVVLVGRAIAAGENAPLVPASLLRTLARAMRQASDDHQAVCEALWERDGL